MARRSTLSESSTLADQLERSFRGGAWHGPAVREALTGIGAEDAGRLLPGANKTIAQLTRHLCFWLEAAHIRIFEGRDADADQDRWEPEQLNEADWARLLDRLESAYTRLHTALRELDDARLDESVAGSDPSVRGLLLGTLQHNAYHTGQIVELSRRLSS